MAVEVAVRVPTVALPMVATAAVSDWKRAETAVRRVEKKLVVVALVSEAA